MRAVLLLAVFAACSNERALEDEDARMKEIDAATFRATIQCGDPAIANEPQCADLREHVSDIERVRVIPDGKGAARYVLTMKTSATKNLVRAEYPGKILDELTAARVPYNVKPRD
jgi:hypothetical protein